MNIDNRVMHDEDHLRLCKMVFDMLDSHLLWVINANDHSRSVLATDQFVLEYYFTKKHYLNDPIFELETKQDNESFEITLGTHVDAFNKNEFMMDLYEIFNIEEFASIQRDTESERYCFRFFTKGNRFAFINKLINNMPVVKYFMHQMIQKLNRQPYVPDTTNAGNRKLN